MSWQGRAFRWKARSKRWKTKAHDCKEEHKHNTKHISDSCSVLTGVFLQNKLETKSFLISNSKFTFQTQALIAGGEKRNQIRDSIKCAKRKPGKVDSSIQCYIKNYLSPYVPPLFCPHFCVPNKSHICVAT